MRELREELGTTLDIDLQNTTHIFLSGKTKPHQAILMVRVDDLYVPKNIPKQELQGAKIVTFTRFYEANFSSLQESLRSIKDDMDSTIIQLLE